MTMKHSCNMVARMMKHDQKRGDYDRKDCPDCPLFAVTTFKEIFVLVICKPFLESEYSVMLNNNLSDYHSAQWKPPNTLRL